MNTFFIASQIVIVSCITFSLPMCGAEQPTNMDYKSFTPQQADDIWKTIESLEQTYYTHLTAEGFTKDNGVFKEDINKLIGLVKSDEFLYAEVTILVQALLRHDTGTFQEQKNKIVRFLQVGWAGRIVKKVSWFSYIKHRFTEIMSSFYSYFYPQASRIGAPSALPQQAVQ